VGAAQRVNYSSMSESDHELPSRHVRAQSVDPSIADMRTESAREGSAFRRH
jgi:hypothetical protein